MDQVINRLSKKGSYYLTWSSKKIQLIFSKNTKIVTHLIVWIAMIAFLNSDLLSLEWGPISKEKNSLLIPLIFGMIINAILFYGNAYWLIPMYLQAKDHRKYWKLILLLVFGLTVIEITFDTLYISYNHLNETLKALPPPERWNVVLELIVMFGALDLLINSTFGALAFLYRLPQDWIKNERQKQQLIQDKLSAELDFLKAQMNPHFLFNGINSIYHLMREDVEKAQKILLQFSELLRYQLYECKEDYIPLKKELQYVSNYSEIETLRKGEDAMINIDLPDLATLENGTTPKIAPLLFSPFLENAFKFLSLYSEKEKNVLEAKIKLEGEMVNFYVKNTVNPMAKRRSEKRASGIGLENAKRRLNILYPQKHKLSIREEDGSFFVGLKIDLA